MSDPQPKDDQQDPQTDGGVPEEALRTDAVGARVARVEGPLKVRGRAAYAYEVPVEAPLYAHLVQSTVARGRVRTVDADEALRSDDVVSVLDHTNVPTLADGDAELAVLQSDAVAFRGQVVAVVVARTPEAAREGARLVRVGYDVQEHRAELRADDPELYAPEKVNPAFETDTTVGSVETALESAAVVLDETYTTPYEHNNPMEPHAVTACWHDDAAPGEPRLTLDASTQSVHAVATALSGLLELEPEQVHVRSPFVGGGFGSKGMPHAHDVAATLAARANPGRPVRLALTRQQMFALAGYRTATIQRVRLAAQADGTLLGIDHQVVEQTSALKEFAEQTAIATRHMYAAPDRATSHRLAALDVAVPSWMRAPGEMPGMAALEMAMDELAERTGVDPVELRVRNEPQVDPESGLPFGHRRLVQCLRVGAARFGWADRDPRPGRRREGDWLVGTGVAASTYPFYVQGGNTARVEVTQGPRYRVSIGAADIGTGATTVLGQIAADALGVPVGLVDVHLGDSSLPPASVAGGSSGTSSWGRAVVGAARALREQHGDDAPVGAKVEHSPDDNPNLETHSLHSFGAQFVELGVNVWTGEPRVRRMLGVFSVGRVVNPTTARSQLIGGMVMGLGGGLLEESVRDARFGHVVTQDLASYHVAAHGDVPAIEAVWLDEHDSLANPMGARGIGEIGIVGTAAAVANAAWHATGSRVRDLPVTLDRLLDLDPDLPALRDHPASFAL
ncbi:xanthine dehydrogenase family protein molybdopterin-binding subunit [Terracoccus luteus]|uniref:Xanthine dehydrogenase YagR molybdenum-binding subunit n=1 Tax=Terracoccus luteus TaxID=53356 RepID=A0A839PUV3_9MICO|nr:xanthine dehydrogenase family protein molybdopterin-binding subunit [Terracoccus luteus]MBB2986803.1 xanthine dehydrogenase YagR molybdenum-binding subunit [Terracoccus luteus]MCP2172454.1 xanthine dehydrogenase YagR molybdenum-binding subunit [Terracoccus luteus]